MIRKMHLDRIVLSALLVLGGRVQAAGDPDGSQTLQGAERLAYDDYMASIEAREDPDPVVDADDSALAGRVKRPERRKYHSPEYPPPLVKENLDGRVVLAGILELDGSVSHVHIIGRSVHKLFDSAALRAVKKTRYTGPVLIDGQPARSFFCVVLQFHKSMPRTVPHTPGTKSASPEGTMHSVGGGTGPRPESGGMP